MKVAQMLRQYIDAQGMRYKFVAERAGVDYQKFSAILNERQGLTADELVLICEHGLQIKPEKFFAYKFQEIGNKGA